MTKTVSFVSSIIIIIIIGLWLRKSYSFVEDSLRFLKTIISNSNQSQDIKARLKIVENDLKKGKKVDALNKLDAIIDLDPNNDKILALYVMICMEEGYWNRAINPAKKMVELQPDDTSYMVLGQIYGGEGMLLEAIETLKKALQLNPNNIGAHEFLGTAYAEAGQMEQAKEEYEKLKKLDLSAAERVLKIIKGGKAIR